MEELNLPDCFGIDTHLFDGQYLNFRYNKLINDEPSLEVRLELQSIKNNLLASKRSLNLNDFNFHLKRLDDIESKFKKTKELTKSEIIEKYNLSINDFIEHYSLDDILDSVRIRDVVSCLTYDNILDEIGVWNVVSHFSDSELLDEIGEEECRQHFDFYNQDDLDEKNIEHYEIYDLFNGIHGTLLNELKNKDLIGMSQTLNWFGVELNRFYEKIKGRIY